MGAEKALISFLQSTYDLFLTEGCKVTLTTPRLVLRPVSLTGKSFSRLRFARPYSNSLSPRLFASIRCQE